MGPEFPVGPWEMQNNQGPLEMTNVYEIFLFFKHIYPQAYRYLFIRQHFKNV